MRSLIIYSDVPPNGTNETGALRRLKLYVNAVGQIADDIEILFFVSQVYFETVGDMDTFNAGQSAYWGATVRVGLVPLSKRRETNWNHYVASSFHISNHPHFHAFCGRSQSEIIAKSLSRKPDFIHVFTLAAMLPLLKFAGRLPPIFFDLDDVEHKSRFRRAVEPPFTAGKLLSTIQSFAIHLAERRANRLARRTIICSETDRRYLAALGLKRLEVIPNAVSKPQVDTKNVAGRTLGFVGNFWHPPNVSAVERLVLTVWPLIRAKVPDARLLIAGSPTQSIPSSANTAEGVEFLGYVDRLENFYNAVSVICCPMMAAGGTRIKLIEAALFGKAIVSTPIGAEGLELAFESEIYVRSLDTAFASACAELLMDGAKCERIGMAARRRAEDIYDVEKIERRIAQMMKEGLGPIAEGQSAPAIS